MHIQHIAKRDNNPDLIYGTGVWNIDEVKNVPDDVATKLLRHGDVFQRIPMPPTAAGSPPVPDVTLQTVKPSEFGETAQELRDKVANFTKAQAIDYVQITFNQKLDRMHSVAELREETIRLIDQFGPI